MGDAGLAMAMVAENLWMRAPSKARGGRGLSRGRPGLGDGPLGRGVGRRLRVEELETSFNQRKPTIGMTQAPLEHGATGPASELTGGL